MSDKPDIKQALAETVAAGGVGPDLAMILGMAFGEIVALRARRDDLLRANNETTKRNQIFVAEFRRLDRRLDEAEDEVDQLVMEVDTLRGALEAALADVSQEARDEFLELHGVILPSMDEDEEEEGPLAPLAPTSDEVH